MERGRDEMKEMRGEEAGREKTGREGKKTRGIERKEEKRRGNKVKSSEEMRGAYEGQGGGEVISST